VTACRLIVVERRSGRVRGKVINARILTGLRTSDAYPNLNGRCVVGWRRRGRAWGGCGFATSYGCGLRRRRARARVRGRTGADRSRSSRGSVFAGASRAVGDVGGGRTGEPMSSRRGPRRRTRGARVRRRDAAHDQHFMPSRRALGRGFVGLPCPVNRMAIMRRRQNPRCGGTYHRGMGVRGRRDVSASRHRRRGDSVGRAARRFVSAATLGDARPDVPPAFGRGSYLTRFPSSSQRPASGVVPISA